MSDFAGGTDTGIQADSGPSFESQAPSTGGQSYSPPPPSSESRSPQPSQSAQTTRNPQGQFVSHAQAQAPAQYQGSSGGQFAGQSRGVLEAFRAAGYDVNGYDNDQSFIQVLETGLSQNQQYEKQIAEYQRQLATRGQPLPNQFEQVQQHLAAPVDTKHGWNPPAYDPRNDQFFRRDEQSGRWIPAVPNVPYELVEAKNAYMEYREAFSKEFSANPIDTLWSRTEDRNRALVREELQSLFGQMQVTKDTNDWLTKHAKVLYVDGQVDHTGDPAKLTPAGQLAVQATDELDHAGVQDAAQRRAFIERYITGELSKQYFTEQADPARRRYSVDEIRDQFAQHQSDPSKRVFTIEQVMQAVQMVRGQGPGQPQAAPDQPQYQPPQAAYAPPEPWLMTPQGWVPNPQFAPQQYAQPQYAQPPFVPQQAWPPQQAASPEQQNQEQKRRFLGGVGHSSSAGSGGGASAEFVPQPSQDGRPNFLGIANQLAQARGVQL